MLEIHPIQAKTRRTNNSKSDSHHDEGGVLHEQVICRTAAARSRRVRDFRAASGTPTSFFGRRIGVAAPFLASTPC